MTGMLDGLCGDLRHCPCSRLPLLEMGLSKSLFLPATLSIPEGQRSGCQGTSRGSLGRPPKADCPLLSWLPD